MNGSKRPPLLFGLLISEITQWDRNLSNLKYLVRQCMKILTGSFLEEAWSFQIVKDSICFEGSSTGKTHSSKYHMNIDSDYENVPPKKGFEDLSTV